VYEFLLGRKLRGLLLMSRGRIWLDPVLAGQPFVLHLRKSEILNSCSSSLETSIHPPLLSLSSSYSLPSSQSFQPAVSGVVRIFLLSSSSPNSPYSFFQASNNSSPWIREVIFLSTPNCSFWLEISLARDMFFPRSFLNSTSGTTSRYK